MNERTLFHDVVSYLAYQDSFTFLFVARMVKTPSKDIPTLGVFVKDGRPFLQYNPDFMDTLTKPEIRWVLMHEVMHITMLHCTLRANPDPRMRTMENIAMDLAINCLLPHDAEIQRPLYKDDVVDEDGKILHKKDDRIGVYPDMYGLPDGWSYEQYFDALKEKFPEGMPEGSEGDMVDSHDGFKQCPEMAQTIKADIEKCRNSSGGWGRVPAGLQAMIIKAMQSEVPWWRYLGKYLGDMVSFEKEETRRKPHKRLGYPFLGTITNYCGAVAVYADCSLSVGMKALSKFGAEVEKIAQDIPVYFQSFDTKVSGEPKLFDNKKLKGLEFKGRGGTDFDCVIADAMSRRYTQLVILTDGECSPPKNVPRNMKIIWCITADGNLFGGLPGRVIRMKNPE